MKKKNTHRVALLATYLMLGISGQSHIDRLFAIKLFKAGIDYTLFFLSTLLSIGH